MSNVMEEQADGTMGEHSPLRIHELYVVLRPCCLIPRLGPDGECVVAASIHGSWLGSQFSLGRAILTLMTGHLCAQHVSK